MTNYSKSLGLSNSLPTENEMKTLNDKDRLRVAVLRAEETIKNSPLQFADERTKNLYRNDIKFKYIAMSMKEISPNSLLSPEAADLALLNKMTEDEILERYLNSSSPKSAKEVLQKTEETMNSIADDLEF